MTSSLDREEEADIMPNNGDKGEVGGGVGGKA